MNFFDDFEKENPKAEDGSVEKETADAEHDALQTEESSVENEQTDTVQIADTKASSDSLWSEIEGDVAVAGKKLKKRRRLVALIVLAIIVALCTAFFTTMRVVKGKGWISALFKDEGNHISFTIPIAEHEKLDDVYYQEDGRYTAQGVYKAVSPSVVSIVSYSSENAFTSAGQGSGIIMTEDGYIITNAHVVESATFGIKVVLADETEYAATLVGSDKRSDLAVIKISAAGLTPARFGDSGLLEVGESVLALGSPAGFYSSLTEGIVSGLDRMVRTEANNIRMNCIQIDAAINPGNSGGALLNMWGEVIGITSSKLNATNYDGIGFAISINAARPIIESLIEFGYVADRPRVGITFVSISTATAEIYDTVAGLYIREIDPKCDIANSGLEVSDTITAINGTAVQDLDDVDEVLYGYKPGDEVTATVYRIQIADEPLIFEIKFKLESFDSLLVEQGEDESSDSSSENSSEQDSSSSADTAD